MNNTLKIILFNLLLLTPCALGAMRTIKRIIQNVPNKNDIFTKGLKLATGGLALTSICELIGSPLAVSAMEQTAKVNACDFKGSKEHILFNSHEQQFLMKQVKDIYNSNEPLYFGLGPRSTSLHTTKGNYIFIKRENYQSNSLDDKEIMQTHYENKPIAVFFNNNKHTIKHEFGHLVLQHYKQRPRRDTQRACLFAGVGIVFNSLTFKKSLSTNSKGCLLKNLSMLMLVKPTAEILNKITSKVDNRKCENEADSFAIKHADSTEELEKGKQFLSSLKEQETEYFSSHSWYLYEKYLGKLSSHPLIPERVKNYQHAIEERKKLESAS